MMDSEHRKTVNFPSKEMLDAVIEISKARHITESKAIVQLVALGLSEYRNNADSTEFIANLDKISKQAQQNDDVFQSELKRTVHAIIHSPEQSSNASKALRSAVSLRREIFDFSGSFKIPVDGEMLEKYTEYMIRKDIQKNVRERIKNKTPHEWKQDFYLSNLGWADKWLILINQIKIEFYCEPVKVANCNKVDGVINVRYKAKDVILLPFTFNKYTHCNAMQHLDFESVKYMTFAEYAKNGWNRSKYSHLVYIEHSSHAKTGGFFIGALYERNNISLREEPPLKTEQEIADVHYLNPNLDITIKYAQRACKITNLRPMLESKIDDKS
ncbi:hypothetical protein [Klebsiella michiganensis]|uniref:hypothetical protein n=1 Tax=Klebsiella michiganensis TaxID=1134687 RepID=UPI00111C8593|nr:hypothetical protein [Klebsiella michiganensis]